MKPYQVLFFDLDHTLVDTRRQYDLGLALTLQEMYGEQAPADFQVHFMAHHNRLWSLYDKRTLTMEELRRQRFLLAWKDFGVEKSVEEADMFHAVYDRTFDETLFVYEGTLSMIEKLAEGHRLGIITNGSPDLQARKLQATGLHRFFADDTVIVSADIGMAKPHPSVYAAAFKALRVRPQDALMIGDNLEADVRGARACGMDALWYVPDGSMMREATQGPHEEAIASAESVVDTVAKLEQARLV